MKPTLMNLTDGQVAYLQGIKAKHGISMSSYIRHLLKRDMENSSTTYSMVDERREIRRTTHMTVHSRHLQPDWKAIKTEMAPILEKRRVQAEKWAV